VSVARSVGRPPLSVWAAGVGPYVRESSVHSLAVSTFLSVRLCVTKLCKHTSGRFDFYPEVGKWVSGGAWRVDFDEYSTMKEGYRCVINASVERARAREKDRSPHASYSLVQCRQLALQMQTSSRQAHERTSV